ncbi:MAG TPA: transcription antitermination factor NusB [Miltoncostaeales bacterium]|jgi:N utilization substance protein B|nr:transcription antitermination factor NusB [Miltoncostaeales bacterium]
MIDDSRRSARRQAVFLLYQRDVTGLSLAELEDNVVRDRGADLDLFTREVVDGVVAGEADIDALVDGAASGWSVDRIAPLERNILRVAVYEIRDRADVPVAVAIDEAVGLAKRYCQADAGKFVNGILGTIARRGGGG